MLIKKSKNYAEQVQILGSKGLEISDKDAVIAFLNRVNYYRFSGYFLAFISRSDKNFRNKTTFEQLKNIYYFDAELRL